MVNIFSEIEDKIFFDESIIFSEEKIKKFVSDFITNRLESKNKGERAFYFEEIIFNFFEYMTFNITKTKKTRDFGLDGIIKIDIGFLGKINLGLQIKYKLIDSNDIDEFLSALKNAELQLGVVVCKDSRRLEKYELNSKIKAILFSKGIEIKKKMMERVDINPVFILKLDDILNIVASEIRAIVKAVYKK